jgi:hypothetical protein
VAVSCIGYAATTLALQQQGSTLMGTVQTCLGVCRLTEALTGTNHGGQVSLSGTADGLAVGYTLTYNEQTQHLVGTRNSAPYWAAPAVDSPANTSLCPR